MSTKTTSRVDVLPTSGSAGELYSETYVVRTMPAVLGKRDMTITAIMALFLLTNAVSGAAGGPVSLVYLAIGAVVFFVPCIVAAIQLGVLLPYEGSLYNWTARALSRPWGFFIGLLFWLSGVLAVTTAGSAFITTLQGLNPNMLSAPWQQGLMILALTFFAALIGRQRMRTIQNLLNLVFILTLAAVCLVGLAAVVWLARGHPSATNFADHTGWVPGPATFFLFAIITLNYIGASGPLNMAGEIRGRDSKELLGTIRQHLLIGTPVVVLLYTVVTTSVLVVRGSSVGPFDGFIAIQQTLGPVAENIAVICYLAYLVMAMVFYTYASARIIMTAGIDQFFPARFARLNKHRAPAFAVMFHACASAVVVGVVFILIPAIIPFGGSAVNATTESYTVTAAACTLVWTIATTFFFVDLVFLYRRDPARFRRLKQFPLWLIWVSVFVGGAACLTTIAAILVYPWVPLISTSAWPWFVGGLTFVIIVMAGLVTMVLSGEANFEQMGADTASIKAGHTGDVI
jgi:amino acid transporter